VFAATCAPGSAVGPPPSGVLSCGCGTPKITPAKNTHVVAHSAAPSTGLGRIASAPPKTLAARIVASRGFFWDRGEFGLHFNAA
jgi:hypothetical protein